MVHINADASQCFLFGGAAPFLPATPVELNCSKLASVTTVAAKTDDSAGLHRLPAESDITANTSQFGLLVDLKAPPSLGVSASPSFSWIVPTSRGLSVGQQQTAFRILVSSYTAGQLAWDSGWVNSSQQSHVRYSASAARLQFAARYRWTLELAVADSDGGTLTVRSGPATFVTMLGAWSGRTKPIWAAAPAAPPLPSAAPPPELPRFSQPAGRFIKPKTDHPTPPGLPGLPGGSLFYERFNDSTVHFVTNCGEHPAWCGEPQQGCYQRLGLWLKASITVSDAYFRGLEYTSGDNFTCADEPDVPRPTPGPPAPAPVGRQSFAMARTEVSLAAAARSAVTAAFVFVTAEEVHTTGVEKPPPDSGLGYDVHARRLLAQYKLFVGGSLIGIGPGRSDDNVSTPYDVFDVSHSVTGGGAGALTIGLQGFNADRTVAKFLLELHIMFANGSKTVHGTNADEWTAFDCSYVFGLGLRGYTARDYRQPQETLNGMLYPRGWAERGFNGSWAPAVERGPFAKQIAPKSTQAISISDQALSSIARTDAHSGRFFFDFGKEIQANLVLQASVPPELAGHIVSVQLGESLRAPGELQFPALTGNLFAASFVLGSGNISLETHEYMEFRFGTISFGNASVADKVKFELRASVVRYPWVEADSAFASSSAVLTSVYDLCKYTLKATSLDTYTGRKSVPPLTLACASPPCLPCPPFALPNDRLRVHADGCGCYCTRFRMQTCIVDSNTRERLPYELDGFIAAKSRLLLQRELSWSRHSFLYNIAYPTWPTEWHQITIKMAHLDWLVTGQKVILSLHQPLLIENTYARFQNATTGLISKPSPTLPTKDIGRSCAPRDTRLCSPPPPLLPCPLFASQMIVFECVLT
eukprot:SAG22_NODE_159_length_16948_cov_14.480503_19_plen_870_part_01